MVYSLEQVVPSYLCDRTDRLLPWAAVRLCQEVTEYHGNSVGGGFEKLVEQNRAWVIVRAYYEFMRRPDAFEKIMLNTWPRGNDGLFAYRDYRVMAGDEVLLTGTSYWTLIDYAQRRAVRLKDYINVYEAHDELATSHERLDKIAVSQIDDPDYQFELQARHSMIDHTKHVNNSEYIKWIFDALAECDFNFDQHFGLELNFQHETKPSDTAKVCVKRFDNIFYAQVSNSSGVSVNAKISSL